jgi:hypothetical protein
MNYMKYYNAAEHDEMTPLDAAADIADYVCDDLGAGDDEMIDLLIHNIEKQIKAHRAN